LTPAGRPSGQRRVLARLVRRLEPDRRLLAGILVGSMAGDDADALSDVDLIIAVREGDFATVWGERASFHPRLYASDQLGASGRQAVTRFLTPNRIFVEVGICSDQALFRLSGPFQVLWDRAGVAARMKNTPPPATASGFRALPGGRDDLPMSLHDSTKHWVRGDRERALRELKQLRRELGDPSAGAGMPG